MSSCMRGAWCWHGPRPPQRTSGAASVCTRCPHQSCPDHQASQCPDNEPDTGDREYWIIIRIIFHLEHQVLVVGVSADWKPYLEILMSKQQHNTDSWPPPAAASAPRPGTRGRACWWTGPPRSRSEISGSIPASGHLKAISPQMKDSQAPKLGSHCFHNSTHCVSPC